MSPILYSIVIRFVTELIVILLLLVLSIIVICGASSEKSIKSQGMPRSGFENPLFNFAVACHNLIGVQGRRVFSVPQLPDYKRVLDIAALKPHSTSSFTSGKNIKPRPAPAIGETNRAQLLSMPAPSLVGNQGNLTFTRPIFSGSLLLVTIPITTLLTASLLPPCSPCWLVNSSQVLVCRPVASNSVR